LSIAKGNDMTIRTYYVWCDEMCDNVTHNYYEARQWQLQFAMAGGDSHIVDEYGNEVISVSGEP